MEMDDPQCISQPVKSRYGTTYEEVAGKLPDGSKLLQGFNDVRLQNPVH